MKQAREVSREGDVGEILTFDFGWVKLFIMPCQAGIDAPGALHHVIIRGRHDPVSKDIAAELFDWKLPKFIENRVN